MSFQNYDSFQGQPPPEANNGAPGTQGAEEQQQQFAQPMDASAGQFPPGGNGGPPGTSPSGPPTDGGAKTTLW